MVPLRGGERRKDHRFEPITPGGPSRIAFDCRTPGYRDLQAKRGDDREAIQPSSYVFVACSQITGGRAPPGDKPGCPRPPQRFFVTPTNGTTVSYHSFRVSCQTVLMRMLILCLAASTAIAADSGWTAYGHDPGGTRYSPLKQIDRTNVAKLQLAWTYHTGALDSPGDANKKSAFEATPILIDATLFLSTPFNVVIALDPVTGREKWKFDPKLDRTQD